MAHLKLKSREQRLVEAAFELVLIEQNQQTLISIPVKDTLYGIAEHANGAALLTVEIDETLDVLVFNPKTLQNVGTSSLVRMNVTGVSDPENIRYYQDRIEIDQRGRVWLHYNGGDGFDDTFVRLADDALFSANLALRHKYWRNGKVAPDEKYAAAAATKYAQDVVRYFSGKIGIAGMDSIVKLCRTPVYEVFVSKDHIEALCYDYDESRLPQLEMARYHPDNWVRNCLTLPIFEYGSVKALIETLSGTEKRSVSNKWDYLPIEACARIALGATHEKACHYRFLSQALSMLCYEIKDFENFLDDPDRADTVSTIEQACGGGFLSDRAVKTLATETSKLKIAVETDFSEDFEMLCSRAQWPLKLSPLELLLIRLEGMIELIRVTRELPTH